MTRLQRLRSLSKQLQTAADDDTTMLRAALIAVIDVMLYGETGTRCQCGHEKEEHRRGGMGAYLSCAHGDCDCRSYH